MSLTEEQQGAVAFDLEKNRAAIDSAINSLLCEGWDNEASTVRRLVAEIERLRASLVEHEEHENQTHEVLGNILGTDDTLENVAKRAAARIKELEDALAEERAKYNLSWKDCAYRAPDTYCEKTHNYCTSEDCPLLDEQKTEARRQLRAEGKIDSGDHFGEPNKLIGFDLEVRWHDDYMKRFSDITTWHCGHATLWIMHSSGKQEWIPLAAVRRISSVEASQ